jgi:hypothetical protein
LLSADVGGAASSVRTISIGSVRTKDEPAFRIAAGESMRVRRMSAVARRSSSVIIGAGAVMDA